NVYRRAANNAETYHNANVQQQTEDEFTPLDFQNELPITAATQQATNVADFSMQTARQCFKVDDHIGGAKAQMMKVVTWRFVVRSVVLAWFYRLPYENEAKEEGEHIYEVESKEESDEILKGRRVMRGKVEVERDGEEGEKEEEHDEDEKGEKELGDGCGGGDVEEDMERE
ncbi:hypothetical protein KSS87_002515, partial [Heliosperma pusillum]